MSFMKFNLSIKEFSGGLKPFIDFTARFPTRLFQKLSVLTPAKEDEKSMKIDLDFISIPQRIWHGLKCKFLSDMDIETNISNGIFVKGQKMKGKQKFRNAYKNFNHQKL